LKAQCRTCVQRTQVRPRFKENHIMAKTPTKSSKKLPATKAKKSVAAKTVGKRGSKAKKAA